MIEKFIIELNDGTGTLVLANPNARISVTGSTVYVNGYEITEGIVKDIRYVLYMSDSFGNQDIQITNHVTFSKFVAILMCKSYTPDAILDDDKDDDNEVDL